MVARCKRPTHQPANAAWYRCVMPSMSSDTLVTLKNLCGYQKFNKGHEKPAKSLAPQRRRGLVQRPLASAPMRRCCMSAAPLVSAHRDERPHPSEFSRCVAGVAQMSNPSACPTTADQSKTTSTGEQHDSP
jgi:hypothetical protein